MKNTIITTLIIFLILSACTFLPPSESDIQTAIAHTLEADITMKVTSIPEVNVPGSSNDSEICFPPSLPGISFDTISEHLEKKGVYCKPMQKDAVSYSTTCEGEAKDGNALIWVEVYSGNRPEDIYLLLSYVDQSQGFPSIELASEILGYIASIPYQNSESIKAQTWVKNNLSKVTVDSSYEPVEFIGGVRFHMSCHMDNLSCLAIGFSQSDYDCSNPPVITESISSLSTPILNNLYTPTPDLFELLTSTPIPPPTPIVLEGSGNTGIMFDKWEGPAMVHIVGESNPSGFFSVKSDLFFTSSWGRGSYDGVKFLDLLPTAHTTEFEIEAGGDWTIKIFPIRSEYFGNRLLSIPGRFEGNGDDVVFIDGTDKYRAVIKGNTVSTNFFIWAYGDNILFENDLIVNVVDVYEGTIDLPDWTKILQVEAVGPWSIEITER